jgi:hypothetical protein
LCRNRSRAAAKNGGRVEWHDWLARAGSCPSAGKPLGKKFGVFESLFFLLAESMARLLLDPGDVHHRRTKIERVGIEKFPPLYRHSLENSDELSAATPRKDSEFGNPTAKKHG